MTAAEQIPAPAGNQDGAPGRTAVFFGGVVPASPQEEHLAEQVGAALAAHGFALLHGGYNGLMEAAARGTVSRGGPAGAVTLAGKPEWGPFNPHVSSAIHVKSLGARLDHYLVAADLVVAMGGGVGTLHELTAAVYYAGNIRRVPVWLAGPTALRLLAFLRTERWFFESPTRPLDFLIPVPTAEEFALHLPELEAAPRRRA